MFSVALSRYKTLHGHLTNITSGKQSCVNSDATQVLASLLKDALKSTVFSCCRKAASDCSSMMKDGREMLLCIINFTVLYLTKEVMFLPWFVCCLVGNMVVRLSLELCQELLMRFPRVCGKGSIGLTRWQTRFWRRFGFRFGIFTARAMLARSWES